MKSISTLEINQPANLAEFYCILEDHDWTYVYSSDHSAYARGQNESNRLRKIANKCPQALSLYVAYSEYIYNGKPKPILPKKLNNNQFAQRQHFIDKLDSLLEKHFSQHSLSITTIASSLAMSERQLYRKIRKYLNKTPSEYLRFFRLKKARAMLDMGKSAVITTYETGFSCQSYFGRCFKKQFGLSPSEYKRARLWMN